MIRFNDVVEILRGPMLDILRQQPFVLQAPDRLGYEASLSVVIDEGG